MLVDPSVYTFWEKRYKAPKQVLKRFGIMNESEEVVVELALKQFNIFPFPSKTLFKLNKVRDAPTHAEKHSQPIYISKADTVGDLVKKINRVLVFYLMNGLKINDVIFNEIRLWKSKYEDDSHLGNILSDIDKRFLNYTHVKIKAEVINLNENKNSTKLYDLDISDHDLIFVELPKQKEFVF